MEPLLYHLYSGQMFFSAAALHALVAILAFLDRLERGGLARSLASIAALASIFAAGLSGTPMPLVQAAVAIAATGAFALFGITAPPRRRRVLASVALVAVVACAGAELRWHLRGASPPAPRRILVVGDSLSSGGFGENVTWPALLASSLGAEVANLALPGESAASAIRNQLPDLPSPRMGDCVIVAIGGNDMLEGLAASSFATSLDQLLTAASASDDRVVVMLELPIVPGEWRFGAIQRHLARKHGVVLIPKRLIAHVLLDPANTYDGLHPTQRGHDAIARDLRSSMGW